jgi:crotonobetainyl-CoA:carnitine CoA-transferase CaiB-like acyl-CoA transferase
VIANKFSGGERIDSLDAPRLGGDTKTVLMEVGYSEAEIDALFRAGAANGIPKATE